MVNPRCDSILGCWNLCYLSGVSSNKGTPSPLVGLFHGTSHLEMDDEQGYPYDLGNHQVG